MNERLNIRRMQVPESRKDTETFDVKKDFTPTDWRAMEEAAVKLSPPSMGMAGLTLLSHVRILDPKRPFPLSENQWEDIVWDVEKDRDAGRTYFFAMKAACVRLIEPDHPFGVRPEELEKLIKSGMNSTNEISALGLAFAMKLLVSDADVSFVEKWREEIPKQAQAYYERGDWPRFMKIAAFARILHLDTDIPKLTVDQWKMVRYEFFDKRIAMREHEGSSPQFAELASNMKIMAAGSVDITKEGLVLGAPKRSRLEDADAPIPSTLEL
jgi:hypothetical protein